jgi:hypothetical protein
VHLPGDAAHYALVSAATSPTLFAVASARCSHTSHPFAALSCPASCSDIVSNRAQKLYAELAETYVPYSTNHVPAMQRIVVHGACTA